MGRFKPIEDYGGYFLTIGGILFIHKGYPIIKEDGK